MASNSVEANVDALAVVPDRLDTLARASAGAARASLPPGAWTPSEIAGHLCDSALYWGARMFRAAHEDRPALPSFDEQELVSLAAYRYRTLDDLLAAFRLFSAGNVALLRGLSAADWDRSGVHDARGPITLREMVAIEAEHEQLHVRQFAEALGLAAE